MTRGELNKYARFLLDKLGTGWLATTDASYYDLDDALQEGYRRVARETRSHKTIATTPAVVGTSVYDLASVSALAARIFDITCVAYNSVQLIPATESYLDGLDPNWRWETDSTPVYWMKWGDGRIKLYPPPSGTQDIYIEGFQTPDMADFNDDLDSPTIHVDDHRLIAVWAAMLVLTRGSESAMAERAPILMQMWQEGIDKAKARMTTLPEASLTTGAISGNITLGDLKKLTQFYLSEIGPSIGGDARFSLEEAIRMAYNRYAIETRAFKADYLLAATPGTGKYALSAFGTAAQRIFEITKVAYNSLMLARIGESYLDGVNPHWRFEASGVPKFWMPWGESKVRVHPAPTGTANIYLEGYETPDLSGWIDDSSVPVIHSDDHKLLAIWAAFLIAANGVTGGDPAAMQAKAPNLFNEWQTGIANAIKRIAGE